MAMLATAAVIITTIITTGTTDATEHRSFFLQIMSPVNNPNLTICID